MSLVKMALIFLAAHVAAALFFLFDRAPGTSAALVGFPLDDAWIHMVYARSLAAFQGFAYNPGQLETGATSPLWDMLLVPASWTAKLLGISVVLPAKLTSIVAGVGVSVGAARVARVLGFGLAVEISAGLAIALDPGLAFAQVSGMEVMLACAIAFWAVGELAADRIWPASIAAALAPLARPEMILLTVPALAILEWRLHRRSASLRTRLVALVPALACVGGWMTYCLLVSGYPLPSTFYAKFSSRLQFFDHNVVLLLAQVLPSWPWFVRGTGFVLWGVGAVVLCRKGLAGALAAAFPVAYLLAVAVSQYWPEALPFYWQRYLLPALPFILLCMAAGGVHAVLWAWQRRHRSWSPARAVVVAILVLGSVMALPSAWKSSANLYAWNCQNIEELNVAMAVWLRDHAAAGETVAVTDAGAARYFGDRPILDMLGLNNHRFLRRSRTSPSALDRIRLVSSFPSLVPFLAGDPAWQPVHRVATGHLTICDCPQSELVAYQRVDSAR
jgi:hypothetical protein